jgi:UDP-N-acetylmuramate: L-alanyl-gamma-D-glutamyl-meso-diaminopimelate ligase
MGAIAGALAAAGWAVSGSDENTYPPMDAWLGQAGIRVATPYSAQNIPPDVELVVIGKRIREDNPELRAVLDLGLAYCSFPALLRDAFLHRSRNAVVAGGVGKTTTTAMLAFILESAGRRPDYFIGGLPRDLPSPARLVGAPIAVLEGDEYASCFDDPGPKFLKYLPDLLIVTNVIEDHPDLYRDAAAVELAFAEAAAALPDSGCLVIPDEDEAAGRVAAACRCTVARVGFSPRATVPLEILEQSPDATLWRFGDGMLRLRLAGRMNVLNAAMALTAAGHLGVSAAEAAGALAAFNGVARRQETRIFGNVALVLDKATHPRAIAALLDSARQLHPNRRVVSIIRPRATGGRDWVYQRDLPAALAGADIVLLLPSYEHNPGPRAAHLRDHFDLDRLYAEIKAAGTPVLMLDAASPLEDCLSDVVNAGDVVIATLPEQDGATLRRIEALLSAFEVDPSALA